MEDEVEAIDREIARLLQKKAQVLEERKLEQERRTALEKEKQRIAAEQKLKDERAVPLDKPKGEGVEEEETRWRSFLQYCLDRDTKSAEFSLWISPPKEKQTAEAGTGNHLPSFISLTSHFLPSVSLVLVIFFHY